MPHPVLVGRNGELAQLAEALDYLDEGGAALLIRGDADIGKTALVSAARRDTEARDHFTRGTVASAPS